MALFDFFTRRRVGPTQVAGVPGTVIQSGVVVQVEKNPRLANPETRWKTYAEVVSNVAIVAAGVRLFLRLVSKPAWKVEPAKDSGAKGEEVAEFIDNALKGMDTPMNRVVRRTAMFVFFGFSIQEWVMKKDADGKLTLRDIMPRPQKTIARWDVDEKTNELRGVEQTTIDTNQPTAPYIPRSKMVYAVDDALTDSPEGMGLFRHLISSADRLLRFEVLEKFGYEVDLRGVQIGGAPLEGLRKQAIAEGKDPNAVIMERTKSMREFMEAHVRNPELGLIKDSEPYFAQDEGKTPSATEKWTLELLQGANAPHAEIASSISRITMEIAMILGVEGLLTGSDGKGSLALLYQKNSQLAALVDSALADIAAVYTRDIVKPLVLLNGWPEELIPTLKPDAVAFHDLAQITTALKDLSTAGAPLQPDDPAINAVRTQIGLPDQPDLTEPLDVDDSRKPAKPLDPNADPADDPEADPEE